MLLWATHIKAEANLSKINMKNNLTLTIGHWLQAHSELERSLEEKIRTLQNQLETEQVECRRLLWSNKDAEKEKQLEVQR